VTQAIANGVRHHHLQSLEKPITTEKWREPKPIETCVFIKEDLGLGSYSGSQWRHLAIGSVFLSSSCFHYDFKRGQSGFSQLQQDIFGPAYRAL
jgi:hypothetical protein